MKYAWIETHRDQYSVSMMCRQLEVSRSGYCQWRVRTPSRRAQSNESLDAKVAHLHKQADAPMDADAFLKACDSKV